MLIDKAILIKLYNKSHVTVRIFVCALAQSLCYFFERLFSLCFRGYRIWIRLATRVSSRRPIFPPRFVSIVRIGLFSVFFWISFFILFYCWNLNQRRCLTCLFPVSSLRIIVRLCNNSYECLRRISVQRRSLARSMSCDSIFK